MQSKKLIVWIWQKLINDILAVMPITQCQFAKEIGVAHNSVHGWRHGRNKPRPEYQLVIVVYCLEHNIENLCEKYGLGNLVKSAKELMKIKQDELIKVRIPRALLSGTLAETIIEIGGESYKIQKTERRWVK